MFLRKRQQRKQVEQWNIEYEARCDAFYAEMAVGGWRRWDRQPPYDTPAVQVMRMGWDGPDTIQPNDINPIMNISGLYWREVPDMVDVTPVYRQISSQEPSK